MATTPPPLPPAHDPIQYPEGAVPRFLTSLETKIVDAGSGALSYIPRQIAATQDRYQHMTTGSPMKPETEALAAPPTATSLLGIDTKGVKQAASNRDYPSLAAEVAAPLLAMGTAHRLLGEHPTVASEAVSEHLRGGGSTFSPLTGENLSGRNLYAANAVPEASQVSTHPPTVPEYQQFVQQHSDVLARHPNAAVGTYYDPQSNLHHTEITLTTPNKSAALEQASRLGEKNIYNLQTHETVPTGASEPDVIPHTIDERFDQARAATPSRTPYSGTHFSDTKLDTIEGARRGASGVGAEGARLKSGEGAPPGFYAYDAHTLPENAIGSRKFANPVKGSFAFGSTDSPEFQTAYQTAIHAGADPGAALNAGEHALRDAGYDGYANPAHPNTKFIFGNHQITPSKSGYIPPTQTDMLSLPEDTEGGTRKLKLGNPSMGTVPNAERVPLPSTEHTIGSRKLRLDTPQMNAPDLGQQARAASEKKFGAMPRGSKIETPFRSTDTHGYDPAGLNE